jgi:hypothetical protein
MDRTFIPGAMVIFAVAYAAAVAHKNSNMPDAELVTSVPLATESLTARPARVSQQRRDLLADSPDESAAFREHVEHKYRHLLADVDHARVEELKLRLLERESELDMNVRERMDAELAELLPAASFTYYQALKESDREQHHLDEYAGGLSNVAPLDEHQQRVVLDAKLRQKERYAAVIRDLGLDRESLSTTDREYAHARSAEALKRYLDEFLMAVSPSLTSEQYTLLKNYETTEFARELSRLQQRINAK